MEGSTKSERKSSSSSVPTPDEAMNEAQEKGYFGETLDPTPDENYTLKGVAAGKPTPETDPDAKAAARQARAEHEARLSAGT